MKNVKETLLNLGLCIDNEYLDRYNNLICLNFNTKKQKFKTQRHHIIPKCYFIKNKIKIDNSSDNIVILSHKDHLIAHYYLSLCAKNQWFKYANELSIRYCTKYIDDDFNYNNLCEYQHLMEEVNINMSKKYKNKKWMHKLNEEVQVSQNDVELYLKNGWNFGRCLVVSKETRRKISLKLKGTHHTTSEETKIKIGNSNRGKKMSDENKKLHSSLQSSKVWYNNGIEEAHIYKNNENMYIELGWSRGRLPMKNEQKIKLRDINLGKKLKDDVKEKISMKLKGVPKKKKNSSEYNHWLDNQRKAKCGKHWYNNGLIEHQYFECPEGWKTGRLINKEK